MKQPGLFQQSPGSTETTFNPLLHGFFSGAKKPLNRVPSTMGNIVTKTSINI
jgi:hypothetical protein